jgi:hypothetical protein
MDWIDKITKGAEKIFGAVSGLLGNGNSSSSDELPSWAQAIFARGTVGTGVNPNLIIGGVVFTASLITAAIIFKGK